MKTFLTFVLVTIIGVGIGFGGAKLYLYMTKKPCGCGDKNIQVREWTETPEFLKNVNGDN